MIYSTRRAFAGSLCGGFAAVRAGRAAGKPTAVQLDLSRTLRTIPADFLGFGYEISSVAIPGLLSGSNEALIRRYGQLGREGVVRIGGNTSDYSHWSPNGALHSASKSTVTNRQAIDDLGAFLRRTNWKLIWGLNLGSDTADSAADQAAAVAKACGDRLLAFEIGNEPDLFVHERHRQAPYDYREYARDYRRYLDVLRQRLPDSPVAGPDVATQTGWVRQFATDQKTDRKLKLLTHHYYAEGPPKNPQTTMANLLASDGKFNRLVNQMKEVSEAAHIPYRLVELNSCFGGGKQGVSDTFASALWGLQLMFSLAKYGGAGINFELGVNQLDFVSHYSPLVSDGNGQWVARPLFYAMLAFAAAGKGQLMDTNDHDGNVYATMPAKQEAAVVLINKDAKNERQYRLSVKDHGSVRALKCLYLKAPSLESTSGVTLAEGPKPSGSELTLTVPPHTAVIAQLQL